MKETLFAVLLMVICSSCLSDLRPKEFRDASNYTEENHQKGLEILKRYAQVSGQEKWDKVNSYTIYMNDDFFGLKGRFAQPFKNTRNQFKLDYYPLENSGTLQFLNGKKKDMVWGYNEGNTYIRKDVNSIPIDVDKKAIKFWIPTYEYFIELPFRISNADIIYYAGQEKYGLNLYDKVFVSWKQAAPQKKIDQYMLWVNQSTGFVDRMQYTIRDQGASFKGTVFIEEHTGYKGIIIPALFKVYLRENGRRPLHIMRPHHFVITDYILE
jgi:hypothetical protein